MNTTKTTDPLIKQEDLLINLLLSCDTKVTRYLGKQRVKGARDVRVEVDAGILLKFDDMSPRSVYTFDAHDTGRLFPSSHLDLIGHPSEILGCESEYGVISDGIMKWVGFRRLKDRPKGICAADPGKHIYYEKHYRVLGEGSSGYFRRIIAFDKEGKPVYLFMNGVPVGLKEDATSAIISCGLKEDAHRKDAYLCSIHDAVELLFPLHAEDVFDFFALREAPLTESGRRKALIHWVSEHLRRTKTNKQSTVRNHYRGITEFTMDGLTVKVTPNNGAS